MNISFENPIYLYFLFLIPVLIFFHFYNLHKSKKLSLKFANFEAIARVKGLEIYSKDIIGLIMNILILTLVVLFISGTVLHKDMNASSFSFVIAIDSSQSMGADDIPPDRISAAKKASKNFIDNLPYESRIAVVSFTGNTFIEQDLTKNKDLLRIAIDNIKLGDYGGTDVFEAISISANLLEDEQSKAVILLSDGQINIGALEEIIDLAVKNDVIIHTIGIGTSEGGVTSFGISKIDENILKALSFNTGGVYFRISNEEEMSEAFNQITPLTVRKGSIDLGLYLGFGALILLVLSQIFDSRRRISL